MVKIVRIVKLETVRELPAWWARLDSATAKLARRYSRRYNWRDSEGWRDAHAAAMARAYNVWRRKAWPVASKPDAYIWQAVQNCLRDLHRGKNRQWQSVGYIPKSACVQADVADVETLATIERLSPPAKALALAILGRNRANAQYADVMAAFCEAGESPREVLARAEEELRSVFGEFLA